MHASINQDLLSSSGDLLLPFLDQECYRLTCLPSSPPFYIPSQDLFPFGEIEIIEVPKAAVHTYSFSLLHQSPGSEEEGRKGRKPSILIYCSLFISKQKRNHEVWKSVNGLMDLASKSSASNSYPKELSAGMCSRVWQGSSGMGCFPNCIVYNTIQYNAYIQWCRCVDIPYRPFSIISYLFPFPYRFMSHLTARILVVLHLVLHYCYQSFGPSVFQNLYLRRLAEWGAVQYSTLLCLEGMILAIRYGRGKSGNDGEVEGPEATTFFKRHALEVYPLYLVACASTWAFQYVMTGISSWTQLLLAGSLVDVSASCARQSLASSWYNQGQHHSYHLPFFVLLLTYHDRRGWLMLVIWWAGIPLGWSLLTYFT